MGAPKQTLGYPSRTAAIAAFRKEGMNTAQIAARIGIEPKTVRALELTHRKRSTPNVSSPNSVAFPLSIRLRLRIDAGRRSMSVDQLMVAIMEKVADDRLVDAILDDAEELAR